MIFIIFLSLQVKAKYRAQVDHLRSTLTSVEHRNSQLSSQVANLTDKLEKLGHKEGLSWKSTNGINGSSSVGGACGLEGVVIKKERRDSTYESSNTESSSSQLEGSSSKGAEQTSPVSLPPTSST